MYFFATHPTIGQFLLSDNYVVAATTDPGSSITTLTLDSEDFPSVRVTETPQQLAALVTPGLFVAFTHRQSQGRKFWLNHNHVVGSYDDPVNGVTVVTSLGEYLVDETAQEVVALLT